MRLIAITQYDEQSMMLAKPVIDGKRRVLLAAQRTIHPKYLERLIGLGISTLIVEDAVSRGITLEEMLDMPTWMDVLESVRMAYEAAGANKPLPVQGILLSAGRLLTEVQRRSILVPMPASTLPEELRPYAHAVNVALLSLQMGRALSFNQLKMRDLAVGCLLHDIGKAISADIRRHPEAGFNILRKEQGISLLSSHVAFQHHELINGKGYPRGATGKEIHEFAQICGLADYYDNLTSEKMVPPHEALEMVMGQNGVTYHESIVQAFVQTIPPYPPGTKVQLQDGEVAIVTKINTHMQRPVVRFLSSEKELSLADNPTVMITGVC